MAPPPDDPSAAPTVALTVQRAEEKAQLEKSLTRLRSLALLMDDRFELPVVGVRFGLDPLIGLIPAWGDWITWSISAYILVEGVRLGVPVSKLLTMGFHAAMDLVTGYVPGIGDIIDVAYKANRRNVNVVLTHFGAEPIAFGKDKGSGSKAPLNDASQPVAQRSGAAAAEPGMVVVPDNALDLPRRSALARWMVGGVLIVGLAALAAVPLLLMWWLWSNR